MKCFIFFLIWGVSGSILKQILYTLMLVILIPALLVFQMLGDSIAGIVYSTIDKLNSVGLSLTMSGVDSFFFISSLIVMVFALLVILQIYAVPFAFVATVYSHDPLCRRCTEPCP